MKIVLLAVGRRHDPKLADAIEDYTNRLKRYYSASWRLIDPARGNVDEITTRRVESGALLAELLPGDILVLLDERGSQWTSPELAAFMEKQSQANGRLVFAVGGAYGVSDAVRGRAQYIWSLSKLIFPHQLVRVVLAEQLYRACTILRGEPYHHD